MIVMDKSLDVPILPLPTVLPVLVKRELVVTLPLGVLPPSPLPPAMCVPLARYLVLVLMVPSLLLLSPALEISSVWLVPERLENVGQRPMLLYKSARVLFLVISVMLILPSPRVSCLVLVLYKCPAVLRVKPVGVVLAKLVTVPKFPSLLSPNVKCSFLEISVTRNLLVLPAIYLVRTLMVVSLLLRPLAQLITFALVALALLVNVGKFLLLQQPLSPRAQSLSLALLAGLTLLPRAAVKLVTLLVLVLPPSLLLV